MTIASPDQRPDEATLEFLRSAFEPEWREPALGYEAVSTWEAENGAVLPEPYRSLVAEIANGSSLGPPEDGGLLPLGWLTPAWPHPADRNPAAPFPLQETWAWEGEPLAEDHDERGADVHGHGSVVLGTDDELSYWVLVVTGPQRGKVWLLSDVGAHPYPGPEALGFLEWVQRWQSGDGWWA
ncbi:SMI1/KNR4 family protein [Streptomyces xanthophaeus]|uniref:SMI1/KNR4 family protein n=1 Tax=Streptomyces xanthophaeus TaxID=67385 RepID=UPI0036D0927E